MPFVMPLVIEVSGGRSLSSARHRAIKFLRKKAYLRAAFRPSLPRFPRPRTIIREERSKRRKISYAPIRSD